MKYFIIFMLLVLDVYAFYEPMKSDFNRDAKGIAQQSRLFHEAYSKGQYEKAIPLSVWYCQAAWAYHHRGNQLEAQGNFIEALVCYEQSALYCRKRPIFDPQGKHLASQKRCLRHALYDIRHMQRVLSGKMEDK